jgi:hypothetical protein
VRAGYPLQRADFDGDETSLNSERAIAAAIADVSEPRPQRIDGAERHLRLIVRQFR